MMVQTNRALVSQLQDYELLQRYFQAHELSKVDQASELKAFLDEFNSLEGFKHAATDRMNVYVNGHVRVRQGLLAAIEFGERVARTVPKIQGRVIGSQNFGNELIKAMRGLEQEQLWLFSLDTRHQIIATDVIHIGSLRTCPFHIRDVIRKALKYNAQSIILAHNHPSGQSEPSEKDLRLSKEMAKAADLFEIALLDSFIVGADDYTSLREEGAFSVFDELKELETNMKLK
ncbi:DNA repair protein RadC [Periweissella fabaria]|uniref:MPN domain-containing protein n=1 Tax=Periweissella fabaria TaxID=546157 RepID=A0ABN8BKY8_9LACO|nr:DNA repair protein RadC [Periweissella fabaria]MCM0597911.1 DNA repair protein RadC [Periweissella fabaria]CAH0417363.1 hypothetical protein WFA24289_01698 [Periweissella fabaria]